MTGDAVLNRIKAFGLVTLALISFFAGFAVESWRGEARINKLKSEYSAAQKAASELAIERLEGANRRADIALADLQNRDQAFLQLSQEKDREIRRLTTGSRCLGSASVRVLNSAGTNKSLPVPETASQPLSADPSFATDTDVGIWINNTQQAYESCRGRIQAIADYFAEVPKQ